MNGRYFHFTPYNTIKGAQVASLSDTGQCVFVCVQMTLDTHKVQVRALSYVQKDGNTYFSICEPICAALKCS